MVNLEIIKTIIISLLISSLLFLSSCTKGITYSDTYSLHNEWNSDSIQTFTLEQTEVKEPQNIFILFNHTNDYPYKNIYLMVTLQEPSGHYVTDTLEYNLTDPKTGKWIGKGFTNTKENLFIFKENYQFKKPGNYTIKVQQGMRQQQLLGVQKLGLIVQKSTINE